MNKRTYLRPDERITKRTFNLTDKEAKTYCRSTAWIAPPKTCKKCKALNPSGNVECCECYTQAKEAF